MLRLSEYRPGCHDALKGSDYTACCQKDTIAEKMQF